MIAFILMVLVIGLAIFAVVMNLFVWLMTCDETPEEKKFREHLSGKR